MDFFGSRAAKRIAIKFVVNYAISGGNFGVAIRSVLPDVLQSTGIFPDPRSTVPWMSGTQLPISLGTSSLSKYIIYNLRFVGEGEDLIALALSRALDMLAKGCWRPGTHNQVKPYTDQFATMDIWSTGKWSDSYSIHDNHAKQSPIVASKRITTTIPGMPTDRAMVAKIGNGVETVTRNYVVKFYSKDSTGAVTYPTESADHAIAAAGYALGGIVNLSIANEFLKATKDSECKRE